MLVTEAVFYGGKLALEKKGAWLLEKRKTPWGNGKVVLNCSKATA